MELGKTQRLIIQRFTSVGAYLSDRKPDKSDRPERSGDILLPRKFVKEEWSVGDQIEVFVLRDGDERFIASTRKPKIEVGEIGMLIVKDVTRVGAFLDWGMEKDLFLPFGEQVHRVKPNEKVFVCCYLDKSMRIAATMRLKECFSYPRHIKENDQVEGLVYATNPDLGAFVVVDGKYNAMIGREKMIGALHIGQKVTARVERVKEDGKLDLSMQARSFETIDQDAKQIYDLLKKNKGYLPFNDSSDPGRIKATFKMSKSQFKKSVGRLLKLRLIQFEGRGIKLKGTKKND